MPSAHENREHWTTHGWPQGGDEWSVAWGSSRALWYRTVLPRIFFALPARHLLEIAPGYGRVTEFLLAHCDAYTGVDLTPKCVEACRERFAGVAKARFVLTDGRSLDALDDGSVELAVSWDSLVHADPEVLESYAHGLARKLEPGGRAFLHHSNLGAFADPATGALTVENPHWRDPRMSAVLMARFADEAGLALDGQELVQWGAEARVDCLSWLRRPRAGEPPGARGRTYLHPSFSAEMEHARWIDEVAGRGLGSRPR